MCVCMYVCNVHVYMCVCACVRACVCDIIYIYIYPATHALCPAASPDLFLRTAGHGGAVRRGGQGNAFGQGGAAAGGAAANARVPQAGGGGGGWSAFRGQGHRLGGD